jgi:hypothetical protein
MGIIQVYTGFVRIFMRAFTSYDSLQRLELYCSLEQERTTFSSCWGFVNYRSVSLEFADIDRRMFRV